VSLIRVPQHSPEDLAAWERWERADRWRGSKMGATVERALAELQAFAAGPCYVGVSWGKDSVVVAHLAWTLGEERGIQIPLVHARAVEHDRPLAVRPNPHVKLVRDAFLERWPMEYRELPLVAVHEDGGHGGRWVSPDDPGGRDVFDAALDDEGRHVSGVRGEESGRRRRRMRRYGVSTDGTCAPIGWWTAEDVYAYLAAYDLPVHPAYAMTFGGRLDRRRLRVSALGGDPGRGHGREEWERHYYGS
jgi:phosphoadenosine phosphosulfate reductase